MKKDLPTVEQQTADSIATADVSIIIPILWSLELASEFFMNFWWGRVACIGHQRAEFLKECGRDWEGRDGRIPERARPRLGRNLRTAEG